MNGCGIGLNCAWNARLDKDGGCQIGKDGICGKGTQKRQCRNKARPSRVRIEIKGHKTGRMDAYEDTFATSILKYFSVILIAMLSNQSLMIDVDNEIKCIQYVQGSMYMYL